MPSWLISKSLSTLSVWTSATQSVVLGPEVPVQYHLGSCGKCKFEDPAQIYWLRISGNSVTSKPSLLKFENCWRKSHLKGTRVDSSGQAAWLYIAVVKLSMLLSRHPKENSMDKTVDWKHTKSNQVVVPAWKKKIEKSMHSEYLIPKKNLIINMNLQISVPMTCQCYRHILRSLLQLWEVGITVPILKVKNKAYYFKNKLRFGGRC